MKNTIAVFSGIIASFLIYVMLMLLTMKLNLEGFGDYAIGNLSEEQIFDVAKKSMFIDNWIILPISILFATVISTIIADNKEYLLGFICAAPIIVYSIHTGTYYQTILVALSILSVWTVKLFKKKKAGGN